MNTITNKRDLFPLSPSQNRIWFMENIDKESTAYNNPLDYGITGDLDIVLLEKSISILIHRHESFRTVFPKLNSHPSQKVLPEIPFTIPVINLENEAVEKRQEIVRQHSRINARYKFDLENGPLFRFELLILDKTEFILLINFHHIITDAASIIIFMDELANVYQSLAEKKPVHLPSLPLTYTEYTLRNREWLESETSRSQLDFWKQELAGAPEILQLPFDYPRPRIQTYNGAHYPFHINAGLKERLSAIGRKHGSGLFVTLLSAFGVLMSKYSSQDDLVIGVPVTNRNDGNLESMVGVLINSLPIRFALTPEMNFSGALGLTKNTFFRAFENQEIPFERLVEEMKIKRGLNISPVFQVIFNYLTGYRKDIRIPGLRIEMLDGDRSAAQTDLTLSVYDPNDNHKDLKLVFEYNTDLFRKDTIARMAGHFLVLLEAIAENEHLPLAEIPLLTSSEKKTMLEEWNETRADYPVNRCIHHLFEEQVTRTPEATAVIYENDSLTYSALNDHANRLARWLAKKGAAEGKTVAIFLDRNTDLPAALLAASKTGSAYLPLDPIYPKARLKLILDDAKPVLILTRSSLKEMLPETGSEIVLIDDKQQYDREPATNLSFGNPQSTAYLLYTSGSTGKPKGVPIRQNSVINLVNAMGKLLKVTAGDILFSVTTIAFDIAELEMYLPLFNGAKLVIGTQEAAMDMMLLSQRLEETGATIFQATPATYKMLTGSSWKGNKELRLICGGEALTKDLARNLLSVSKEVWNSYGPTETAIYSVAHKVTEEDISGEGYVPIGRPLDNTTLYVLNPKLVPVPTGLSGELYIGGDGVSPGYLNLPDLSRERFIPDPFSKDPGERLYKTGDLVRYNSDGILTYLNRIDYQVKIRGFRIELGEIESAISQYEGIRENVVVVKEDPAGDKKLVAYYIPNGQQSISHQELRQYLRERIPDYMIPSAFVALDRFPLTANNKVDRKALPDPAQQEEPSAENYTAPGTPTEEKLASIWKSLLKLKKVSIYDDFFDIGGHSMIAVSLMIRIEKEFGLRLPLATLFDRSTISRLAELIDQGSVPVTWRSLVPIRPQGSKKPLFLVHGLGLNVLLYTTIVNYLDPDQPVYGLQAKGLNGKDEPLDTIEEIASYYISEIMTVDPEGPYAMAGFSLGGKIAFEMARQLVDRGKQVSFLGMFDAAAEGSVRHLPLMQRISHNILYTTHFILWNIGHLFSDPDENKKELLKRKWRGLVRKITKVDVPLNKEAMVSEGKKNELPRYLRKVYHANHRADRDYIVGPYSGNVHLFKAKKQTFYLIDPVNYGWDKVAGGGVVIHEIPGEHSRIFAPPNDKYFAEILQKNLNNS